MANPPVEQSTRWETRIVKGAIDAGRSTATRLPKTGIKHEPDVLIPGKHRRPAVAWERWEGKKKDGRRRAVRMVTITETHFYELLALDKEHTFGYYVQNKSTQSGSLSNWLTGLADWVKERKDRYT